MVPKIVGRFFNTFWLLSLIWWCHRIRNDNTLKKYESPISSSLPQNLLNKTAQNKPHFQNIFAEI